MRKRKVMLNKIDTGAFGGCNAKLILEAILDIRDKTTKEKRKPSKFNLFVGEKMKEGKSMKEASRLWKKTKK